MAGGEFRFGTTSIYMRRTQADRAARYNSQPRYYMATDLDRVGQFFPDFRRFIVMASRKLGLRGNLSDTVRPRCSTDVTDKICCRLPLIKKPFVSMCRPHLNNSCGEN